MAKKRAVKKYVNGLLDGAFKSLLMDIDYRIKILSDLAQKAGGYDTGRLNALEANLPFHVLDGFTFTDNSPDPGSIAWTDCHIVYKGTDNTITNGNSANKYICWLASSPTAFTCGDVKPELTADDVLVAINDSGTTRLMIAPGKMPHGSGLLSGTVDTAELKDGCATAQKIGAAAVSETKLNIIAHLMY